MHHAKEHTKILLLAAPRNLLSALLLLLLLLLVLTILLLLKLLVVLLQLWRIHDPVLDRLVLVPRQRRRWRGSHASTWEESCGTVQRRGKNVRRPLSTATSYVHQTKAYLEVAAFRMPAAVPWGIHQDTVAAVA